MALTMTRTRTQTALTKLVERVAAVHGEMARISHLQVDWPEYQTALERRKCQLEAQRAALYVTLRQFDPELDPASIGESMAWLKPYGRRGSQAAQRRYVQALVGRAPS